MVNNFRAMLSMSAVLALSRVTGYVRTMVAAAVLGTGMVANAFAVASGLPTLIYNLFIGGILWSIFVPLLVERLIAHGEEDAQCLTNALLTLILPFLAVVALLGVVFAEPLMHLSTRWEDSAKLSPEVAQETTRLAVLLFRFSILHVFFYGIGTVGTGVLNAHRRFFLPAFAPVLNNLFAVACFLGYALLAPKNPGAAVYLLAATTLGVAVMSLVLLPTMYHLGYRVRPVFGHPGLLPAMRLAGPMLVFVAAGAGVQVFATLLATEFNAAPQLGYAFVVFSLPFGIFNIALETTLMRELSEKHARRDTEGYREILSAGLRTMAFITVPASVGLITLATPTIGFLYQRGRFTAEDTRVVANILVAYSVGLLGYSTYSFLIRASYSRQNTKTPAILNVGLFALYVVLAYGLSRVVGLVGMPLAVSVTYAILALFSLEATRREIKGLRSQRLLRSLVKILIAGVAMYAVGLGGTSLLGTGSSTPERVLILAVVGGVSLVAYLGVAFLLKAEELKPAVALLRRRVIKVEDQKGVLEQGQR